MAVIVRRDYEKERKKGREEEDDFAFIFPLRGAEGREGEDLRGKGERKQLDPLSLIEREKKESRTLERKDEIRNGKEKEGGGEDFFIFTRGEGGKKKKKKKRKKGEERGENLSYNLFI